MKTLRVLVVVCVLSLAGATFATVTSLRAMKQDTDNACARRAAIVDAFDAFTDALIVSAIPEDPERLAAYEERAAAFRAEVDESLAPLEPTNC